NSLQAHGIQEPCRIADDHSPIEIVLRLRPVATLRNGLCAVGMYSAAGEQVANKRMVLEFLKSLVRIRFRIVIIETDDQTDGHLPIGHVVDKPSAEFVVLNRPSQCVDHPAAGISFAGDIPNFFYSK